MGKERTDNRTGGAFRTDILTPPALLPETKLRKKIPNLLKEEIKRGDRHKLYLCALNYARQYGFSVETPEPKNTAGIAKLLEELKEKSSEGICLHVDKNGNLRLSHGSYVTDGWTCYFIPLEPTFRMSAQTGLTIRRFIKKYATAYGLEDIMKKVYFEWAKEISEGELEEYDSHPEYFECERKDLEFNKDYEKDGIAYAAIEDYSLLKPLTKKEMLAFKPANEFENKLKKIMERGFKLIQTDFKPWNHATYNNPFEIEEMDMENTQYIPFSETCAIIYDYDLMTEKYSSVMNDDVQCGVETEVLSNIEEILPDNKLTKTTQLKEFIAIIDELNFLLNNMEEKKTT